MLVNIVDNNQLLNAKLNACYPFWENKGNREDRNHFAFTDWTAART